MKAAAIALLAVAIALTGCASEVDKCVAAWEAAYADIPNDDVNRFCINNFASAECGHGSNMPNRTKSQAIAEQRMRCLRASQGLD